MEGSSQWKKHVPEAKLQDFEKVVGRRKKKYIHKFPKGSKMLQYAGIEKIVVIGGSFNGNYRQTLSGINPNSNVPPVTLEWTDYEKRNLQITVYWTDSDKGDGVHTIVQMENPKTTREGNNVTVRDKHARADFLFQTEMGAKNFVLPSTPTPSVKNESEDGKSSLEEDKPIPPNAPPPSPASVITSIPPSPFPPPPSPNLSHSESISSSTPSPTNENLTSDGQIGDAEIEPKDIETPK